MSGIMSMLLGAVSSAAAAVDEFFNRVTLLLPGNGTNGAQNNTFLDSSSNNFTITRNGNTTQGTFSPFSQTGWSNYFDGTDDRLSVPDASKLELGSGAFTIECFAYNTAWDVDQNQLFEKGRFSVGKSYRGWMTATAIVLEVNVSGSATGAYTSFSVSTTNNLNQWYHVAFVRSGNSIYIFKDGVQIGSTGSLSGTVFDTSEVLAIGGAADGNNNIMMNGYISNFRIITGQALATGTFSIPTAPLSTSSSGWTVSGSPVSLTGTVALLTCQSNRFVDNSASPVDITVGSGTPSVQAFSPFAPTAAYDAATVGGSGYFDGTGDYLSLSNSGLEPTGTNDFTYETWVYNGGFSGSQYGRGIVTFFAPASYGNNRLLIRLNSGANVINFYLVVGGSVLAGTSGTNGTVLLTPNAWSHLAVVRRNGVFTVYINGVQDINITNITTASLTGFTSMEIGRNQDGGTPDFFGYMSNSRYIRSQALTSGAFTPPTALVTSTAVGWTGANAATSITGTVALLCNFTNAGITDATAKNVLETGGSAQISTSTSKFGGSSISFDGNDDYLVMPYSPNYNFGTGQFTIECWVNFSTLSSNRMIFDTYTAASAGGGYQLYWRGTGTSITFYANGVVVAQSSFSTHSTDVWYHVAVTRDSSNVVRIFIDGTQYASTTYATAIDMATTARPAVGIQFATLTNDLHGYISDFRITKGLARYTGSFTPPSSAFPLQ